LENKAISIPNCLSGTAGSILDRGGRAPNPQAGLLDSATALILSPSTWPGLVLNSLKPLNGRSR
jgi:hypothetical protein